MRQYCCAIIDTTQQSVLHCVTSDFPLTEDHQSLTGPLPSGRFLTYRFQFDHDETMVDADRLIEALVISGDPVQVAMNKVVIPSCEMDPDFQTTPIESQELPVENL